MEIDQRYSNLGLGLANGSFVALAEGLGIRRIATRDVRHFAAVRLRDGTSFELVVQPSDPDRS
jgi:predicted nucleic acid-binding protein